jgi:type I restriction enzyme S subunit
MQAKARLADICLLVTDGTHDSPRLLASGVPFIKGKHISQGRIDFENCDFISEVDHVEACRRVKPRRGDVLFSNIGSVGDTALVACDREFSIKNVALFRPNPGLVDPRYFYFLITSPTFKEPLLNLRSGAAQPFLSLQSLRGYETVYVSDKQKQRRIASILGAYDDLIEVNRRRIAVLEEMARRLFEEWFVHFRFLGHDLRTLTPTDQLPQGWATRKLSEACSLISRGITPTYDESSSSLVIGQKCIRDQRLSLGPARAQRKPVPAEKVVRVGDVLINSTGVGTLGAWAAEHRRTRQGDRDLRRRG